MPRTYQSVVTKVHIHNPNRSLTIYPFHTCFTGCQFTLLYSWFYTVPDAATYRPSLKKYYVSLHYLSIFGPSGKHHLINIWMMIQIQMWTYFSVGYNVTDICSIHDLLGCTLEHCVQAYFYAAIWCSVISILWWNRNYVSILHIHVGGTYLFIKCNRYFTEFKPLPISVSTLS